LGLAGERSRRRLQVVLNVILVDRSPLFTEALAARLSHEPDIRVLAAVLSVGAVGHLLERGDVDVAVCEESQACDLVSRPGSGGRAWCRPRVVVLAESGSNEQATALVQVGITGWVTRDQPIELLLETIRGAARGETRIPPTLLTRVLSELTAARQKRLAMDDRLGTLTEREREILLLLGDGLDRGEVAARLHLSEHTVRTHLQNIRTSLAVHSTLAAVAVARAGSTGAAAAG
jgi:DNA-binding NarL/FixJ family response regulator